MMRFTAALALCVLLAGCLPILPPAMSVASLGVSGFSVLTTGKSASDHVLSATNEQDCALYRLAFGQSMCREYREGETRITVSYDYDYPGGDADGGFDLSDTQLAAAPAPEERKTESAQDDGQRVTPTIRPDRGRCSPDRACDAASGQTRVDRPGCGFPEYGCPEHGYPEHAAGSAGRHRCGADRACGTA